MKSKKTNRNLTKFNKKSTNIGKFFVIFVFFCFFLSIILLSNVFATLLNVKNIGLFATNINTDNVNLYCIAFGDYETEQSAQYQSELLKKKGGAGFIYKTNQNYTILLSGYLDEKSCDEVLNKNKDNFEQLHIQKISIPKTNYSYRKTTTNIQPLKDIVNLNIETFNCLHNISNKYDSGELLSSKVYNELFNLAYDINTKIENFKSNSMLTSENNYIKLIKQAENIYSKVNSLILNTSKNELSQNIKYCYLDIILLSFN